MAQQILFPWQQPIEEQPSTARESGAAATRGLATTIPALIRFGSGFGSFAGPLAGAASGAGGEIVAQMIERGTFNPSKLNLTRVGVEAGLGAIPGGKFIKAGQVGRSALLGAGAAGAGIVGRKAADVLEGENPDALKQWGGDELKQALIGAAVGGAVGHVGGKMNKPPAPTPTGPPKRVTVEDFLNKANPKSDAIESMALKGEARAAANAPSKFDTALSEAGLMADPNRQAAHGLRVAAVKTGKANDTTAKAVVAGQKATDVQEARNLNAADKAQVQQQRAADEISEAEQKWIAQYQKDLEKFAKEQQKARQSGAAADLEVAEAQAAKLAEDMSAAATQRTKEGLVPKKVEVREVTQGTDVFGKKTTATKTYGTKGRRGNKKTEPTPAAAAPIATVPPTKVPEATQAMSGSPKEILAQQAEAMRKAAAERHVDESAALRGTPADIPPTPEAQQLERQRTAIEGLATGGPQLPAPLAIKAGQVMADTPPGSTIMRFFKDRDAANKAAAYGEEMPEEMIGVMNQLLGKAEVTPRAPDTATANPRGQLWSLIQQISKAKNLPQFPRGSHVKPNLKHVPAEMRPAAAPIVEQPAAPPPVAAPAAPPAAKKATPKTPAKPKKPVTPKTSHPGMTPGGRVVIPPPASLAGKDIALPGQPTGAGVGLKEGAPESVGLPVTQPNAPVPQEPIQMRGPEQPVPPKLQAKMETLNNKAKLLVQQGKADSPEMMKLEADMAKLTQEITAARYPQAVRAEQEAAAVKKAEAAKPRLVKDKKPRPKLSANPMFDPESYRWAAEGLGAEGLGAIGGATIGGLTNEDDPLMGALLGGAAGYGLGRGVSKLNESGLPLFDTVREHPLANALAGLQRFSYLSNPQSLIYNTFLAPQGAGIMGSAERALVGKAEELTGASPDASEKVQQGLAGLKGFFSGRNLQPSTWKNAWNEARDLIGAAERGEAVTGEATSLFDKGAAAPGTAMTAGDVVGRGTLTEAGIPEEIARAMTVTSNPRYKGGEALTDFAKKHPSLQFLVPFSRTAANVVEGGLERTPLVGMLLSKTNDPEVQATMTEMLVRQGIGAASGYAGYQIGLNTDPELNRTARIDMLAANMSGQYGLLTAAGFAIGQAVRAGKIPQPDISDPTTWGDLLKTAGTSYATNLPLPTTRAPMDLVNSAANYLEGQPAHPEADTALERWLPRAFTPGIGVRAEEAIRNPEESLMLFPWQQ